MTTLLLTHEICLQHDTPPGHPERGERLRAILAALDAPRFAGLAREQAPLGREADILRAHTPAHLAFVKSRSPEPGRLSRLDPDTVMSARSLEAARLGVGACTRAVDAVFSGEADTVFCAVRPPGHHAETARAMGFCLFNAIAIAALYAREVHGAARVAVMDFDVHHGNGTQEIFWPHRALLYASTHEAPLFPGTGIVSETGIAGNIVNAPLRAGDGGTAFRQSMTARILPALDNFASDLLLVSAGFDAHHADPLGHLQLDEADFFWATSQLMEISARHCGGRLISTLEGGYDLGGLASSCAAHVAALMGQTEVTR